MANLEAVRAATMSGRLRRFFIDTPRLLMSWEDWLTFAPALGRLHRDRDRDPAGGVGAGLPLARAGGHRRADHRPAGGARERQPLPRASGGAAARADGAHAHGHALRRRRLDRGARGGRGGAHERVGARGARGRREQRQPAVRAAGTHARGVRLLPGRVGRVPLAERLARGGARLRGAARHHRDHQRAPERGLPHVLVRGAAADRAAAPAARVRELGPVAGRVPGVAQPAIGAAHACAHDRDGRDRVAGAARAAGRRDRHDDRLRDRPDRGRDRTAHRVLQQPRRERRETSTSSAGRCPSGAT